VACQTPLFLPLLCPSTEGILTTQAHLGEREAVTEIHALHQQYRPNKSFHNVRSSCPTFTVPLPPSSPPPQAPLHPGLSEQPESGRVHRRARRENSRSGCSRCRLLHCPEDPHQRPRSRAPSSAGFQRYWRPLLGSCQRSRRDRQVVRDHYGAVRAVLRHQRSGICSGWRHYLVRRSARA
jgi:hypothetical protein